jgi:hypothetical protein
MLSGPRTSRDRLCSGVTTSGLNVTSNRQAPRHRAPTVPAGCEAAVFQSATTARQPVASAEAAAGRTVGPPWETSQVAARRRASFNASSSETRSSLSRSSSDSASMRSSRCRSVFGWM